MAVNVIEANGTSANVQVAQRGLSYRWTMAIVLIFGLFMSILDQTVVGIAIPRLQNVFGADLHSVQWVSTVYLLTQGAITPVGPYLANRLGIKRVYITSLALFTIGSAMCGLAWSLPVLVFFRILQGLGGAIMMPLSMTMIYREFPLEERGRAMASLGVPMLMAPALGPIVGGYLVTYADWQWIFYINVPIGIIAFILCSTYLRESALERGARFDLPGFITAAYGLAALLYGFSQVSTDGWGSTRVLGFVSSGVLSLILFVAIEIITASRGGSPLLDVRLFLNRSFAAANLAMVSFTVSMYGAFFFLPLYLQILRGQTAFQTGLLLLPLALASMVSMSIGGRLVDRIGPKPVIIPGLLLITFSSWQLTFLTTHSPFWWVQTMLALFGFSMGMIMQPLSVGAMRDIRNPGQIAFGTTLMTVTRLSSASLMTAVLTSMVQTQSKVHFAHLAESVVVGSPLGNLFNMMKAMFIAKGMDMFHAQQGATMTIYGMLFKQSYLLGIRDAFFVSIACGLIAIFFTLFIGGRSRKPASSAAASTPEAQQAEEERKAAVMEAALAG